MDLEDESLYAVPFRNSVVLGIKNPVFADDLHAEPISQEIPPQIPPPRIMSASYRTFALNSPLYINHVDPAIRTNTNSIKESNGPPHDLCKGRQFKEKESSSRDNTTYSSCQDDLQLTRESLRDTATVSDLMIANEDNEYEKGGYLQPQEVFDNTHSDESKQKDVLYSTHTLMKRAKEIGEAQTEGSRCPDEDTAEDEYLSPTDPPFNEGVDLINIDIPRPNTDAVAGSNTYTGTPKKHEFQRFDSGVDDCESRRGSNPSIPALSPTPYRNRLSTFVEQHYEDIDLYMNEGRRETVRKKEENTKKSVATEAVESANVHILPPSVRGRSSIPSCTQHINPGHNKHILLSATDIDRRGSSNHIQSPSFCLSTYMPMDEDVETCSKQSQGKSRGKERYVLFGVLMVLFVLSTVSLGISIYMLAFQKSSLVDDVPPIERSAVPAYLLNSTSEVVWSPEFSLLTDTEKHLYELQFQLHKLKKENTALKESVQKQDIKTMEVLEVLTSRQENMSLELDTVSSNVDYKIANLTQSLQGGPNVSSLSSCTMKLSSFSRLTSKGVGMETAYAPSEEDLQDSFVLFAFCTHMGMVDVNLEVIKANTRDVQYRCRCAGLQGEGHLHKVCTLYYWLCPRPKNETGS